MKTIFLKTIFALVVCFSTAIPIWAQTSQQTPETVAKATSMDPSKTIGRNAPP